MWYNKSAPDQIQPRPWLSDAAVQYFESLLTPEMNVVEFGGGGSTLWLAERVQTVTTYENNFEWFLEIRKHQPKNVQVLYLGTPHFSLAETNIYYHLLFIDGEPIELRANWLKSAKDIVKASGYVVLDNANRPEYAKERAALDADLIHTVDANEAGTQYLVTEFYRMR